MKKRGLLDARNNLTAKFMLDLQVPRVHSYARSTHFCHGSTHTCQRFRRNVDLFGASRHVRDVAPTSRIKLSRPTTPEKMDARWQNKGCNMVEHASASRPGRLMDRYDGECPC